jgi:hypothetical protein
MHVLLVPRSALQVLRKLIQSVVFSIVAMRSQMSAGKAAGSRLYSLLSICAPHKQGLRE